MVVYNDRSDGTLVYTAYDNADGSGDSYEGTVEITKTWTDPLSTSPSLKRGVK